MANPRKMQKDGSNAANAGSNTGKDNSNTVPIFSNIALNLSLLNIKFTT